MKTHTAFVSTVVGVLALVALPSAQAGWDEITKQTGLTLAFLRGDVGHPVVLEGTSANADHVFHFVTLRNPGQQAISAVRFEIRIVSRSSGKQVHRLEEIRRLTVPARASRRLEANVMTVETARQLVQTFGRSLQAELSIDEVEFEGGSVWRVPEDARPGQGSAARPIRVTLTPQQLAVLDQPRAAAPGTHLVCRDALGAPYAEGAVGTLAGTSATMIRCNAGQWVRLVRQ